MGVAMLVPLDPRQSPFMLVASPSAFAETMCAPGANNPIPSFSNTVGPSGEPTHRWSGVATVVAPTATALRALAGSSTCPPLPGAMKAKVQGCSKDQRSRVSLRAV